MAILKNSKGEPIEFVMYDDSILDRHSERILVRGIRLANHKDNPVALYQHRYYDSDTYPIGRWVNVRKDGSRLLGNLDIDDKDPKAREVGGKIERGYLRAVSISVDPIERSDDPSVLLPGQRYKTHTVSDLLEGSIVILPSHPKAVPTNHKVPVQRSFFDASSQSFVSFPDVHIERGVNDDNNHEKPKEKNMSDYSEVIREFGLGLSDDASKEQVFAALRAKLPPAPTPAPTTTTTRSESSSKQVDDLIAWGKVKGLIDSGNESVYRSLAEGDYSKAFELIEKSAGTGTATPQGQKPDEQKPVGGAEDLTASVGRALAELADIADKERDQKPPDTSKMSYAQRMAYKMEQKHGIKKGSGKEGLDNA